MCPMVTGYSLPRLSGRRALAAPDPPRWFPRSAQSPLAFHRPPRHNRKVKRGIHMKTRLFLLCALVSAALAADLPYAGKWKVNLTKSDFGQTTVTYRSEEQEHTSELQSLRH